MMKRIFAILLLAPLLAFASGDEPKLDAAPVNLKDNASLQRGAATFVNYCLNCHSAAYMRYNRLTDIGLTEDQIKNNLMFAAEKVGQTMTVSMDKTAAKQWFGAAPPDLTVISRSRGADWLYTYLRGFYRDDTRPTGWNNVVYDRVAMPHVLWQLQGIQALQHAPEGQKGAHAEPKLVLEQPGSMTAQQYDQLVGDLVNYLVYMGEPGQTTRMQIGWAVLIFLGLILFPLAYLLKKEFWKDVH